MHLEPAQAALFAYLAGGAAVWLVWSVFRLRAVEHSQPAPPAHARPIDLGWARWGGLGLLLMALASLPVAYFLAQNARPGEWLYALFLGAFLAGMGSLTGWQMWCARIYVGEAGIWGLSMASTSRFIAWHEIRRVCLSGGMQALQLIGARKPVYVPLLLDDYPGLLRTLRERAPQARFEFNTDLSKEQLLERNHQASLVRHSHKLGLGAAAVFALTLTWLAPCPVCLALSGAGGALLALPTLLYFLLPERWRSRFEHPGAVFQMAGFGVLGNIAYSRHEARLGGPEAIDAATGLAMIAQNLSFALASAFLLVALARYIWPRRFDPEAGQCRP